MARRLRPLIKAAVVLAVVPGLVSLILHSVQETRAEPYAVPRAHLAGWTLVLDSPAAPSGALLSLQPPPEFRSHLFRQPFARAAESFTSPTVPFVPIVLADEFERALAGFMPAAALLGAARAAGLESAVFEPTSMGYRRNSAPGVTRQLDFVLFDAPAFEAFRTNLAARRPAGSSAGAPFEPEALSAVLLIAESEPAWSRWLPLRADPARDCVAPVTTG